MYLFVWLYPAVRVCLPRVFSSCPQIGTRKAGQDRQRRVSARVKPVTSERRGGVVARKSSPRNCVFSPRPKLRPASLSGRWPSRTGDVSVVSLGATRAVGRTHDRHFLSAGGPSCGGSPAAPPRGAPVARQNTSWAARP